MKMKPTASGILIPKREGVDCRYCFRKIYQEQEPNGRLRLVDGKPMCPTCRAVKLSNFNKQILGDKRKHLIDKDLVESKLEADEATRVGIISSLSVEKSKTANKNKRQGL
jgi:hypothetical protein